MAEIEADIKRGEIESLGQEVIPEYPEMEPGVPTLPPSLDEIIEALPEEVATEVYIVRGALYEAFDHRAVQALAYIVGRLALVMEREADRG